MCGANWSSAALVEIVNENVASVCNRQLIIMRISATHTHYTSTARTWIFIYIQV